MIIDVCGHSSKHTPIPQATEMARARRRRKNIVPGFRSGAEAGLFWSGWD